MSHDDFPYLRTSDTSSHVDRIVVMHLQWTATHKRELEASAISIELIAMMFTVRRLPDNCLQDVDCSVRSPAIDNLDTAVGYPQFH